MDGNAETPGPGPVVGHTTAITSQIWVGASPDMDDLHAWATQGVSNVSRMRRTVLVAALVVSSCKQVPQISTEEQFDAPPATEDSGECLRSAASGYSDPADLARDYVDRDGAGEFTRASRWLQQAHYCPGHLPGWDLAALVKEATVDSVVSLGPVATAYVTYRQLGRVGSDGAGFFAFEEDLGDVAATIQMVRLEDGWRVRTQQRPHLLPAAALARPRRSDSLRAVIERLARN